MVAVAHVVSFDDGWNPRIIMDELEERGNTKMGFGEDSMYKGGYDDHLGGDLVIFVRST
jgi:hypothetical protein